MEACGWGAARKCRLNFLSVVGAQLQTTTAHVQFRRQRRRAIEHIALLKGRRKQLGVLPIELFEPFFGEGVIAEKLVILMFGSRQTQGTVALCGLRCYSGHSCLRL